MEYTQERLDAITAQIAALSEERKVIAKKVGSPLVADRFADLFTYPGVSTAQWTQYTPYFNDGDPCEFTVHGLSFNGSEDEDGEGVGTAFSTYSLTVTDPKEEVNPYLTAKTDQWQTAAHNLRRAAEWDSYQEYKRAAVVSFRKMGWTEALVKLFTALVKELEGWLESNESFLQDAFGDGVAVIVSANGVEVEEYEHD